MKLKNFFLFSLLALLLSCSSDPIVYTLTATADPAEGGQVVPEYMEYGEGDTAYVVATPSDEYVLESWSGDASGNANTLVITMDKNKDVTAHFVKKKYPLTIKIEGEGEVKQEVIKQGMARDYNSGTIVKLTAEPDGEWLFVRWRGDLTGNENPTQITIDGPKTVVAEFEKKKYPLTIEIVGEGQVAEKVIKPGAPNDYNSGTIVELEALSGQSWEFSEWQVDLTGTQNPKQITINSPKTVRAVFVESSPVYLDENGVTIKAHDWAAVGQEGVVDGVTYKIVDRDMLFEMLKNGEDVTKVCTTKITSMRNLIIDTNNESFINNFNQNISSWDVSNVTNMRKLFWTARKFNQDISNWDVSNVKDMWGLFFVANEFNQDISNWDVSNVEIMVNIFTKASKFNFNIGNWDVSNVKDFRFAFSELENVNLELTNWDVSSGTTFEYMFYSSKFTGDISNWTFGDDVTFRDMFSNTTSDANMSNWTFGNNNSFSNMFTNIIEFTGDISNWTFGNNNSLAYMFYNADLFTADISSWDVSKVTSTYRMFAFNDNFNDDISSWNTESLENMEAMFAYSNFNQPIGNWNTSSVTNMRELFGGNKKFNQPLGNWDTSNVVNMGETFWKAESFNQDISSWNVSNVENMYGMFWEAYIYNKDLSSWDVEKVTNCEKFYLDSANSWTLPRPNFTNCYIDPNAADPIIGTWTLTNEVWVGSGTWPDGQMRGCWKSGDEGSPDQYIFTQSSVTKKVWECDQDGKFSSSTTFGPLSWSNLGNGSYSWAGETIQVVFENNNTIMKLPFDDGNILQTWTKN